MREHHRADSEREGTSDAATTGEEEPDTAIVGQPISPLVEADTKVGAALGRYVVLEEIGRGGMGRVLRAYDPKLQREVALKEVRAGALDDEGQARLVVEARAMAKLSHPNVVAVYDVEEVRPSGKPAQLVLVMEYVAGASLSGWLREADRKWADVVGRFVAAGRGLAAAHAAGLLHRDFKPANVLIGAGDLVKVTDFGLAKPHAELESIPDSTGRHAEHSAAGDSGYRSDGLTQAGIVLGTPRYMAPEQHRGQPLTAAADQYAFCVALWEALCREPPFSGKGLADRKLAGPPAWSGTSVPRAIVDALRRGLSPEPEQRWPDVEALLDALDDDPARRRARRLGWLGGAGLLAAAGATWFSWDANRGEQCGGADARLAGVWDEARRAQMQSSMLAVNADFAELAWAHTAESLDRYADAWSAMYSQTCEATTIRGEQSPAVMDLRMACLHRARVQLEATTSVLTSDDPEVVRRAHLVVGKLRPLSRCADVDALKADVEPPSDDDTQRVDEARARLAAAKAERQAGHYDAAKAALEEATRLLGETQYEPAQSEVKLEEGVVFQKLGSYDASEAAFRAALRMGSKWRQTVVVRDAAIQLMSLVGSRQHDPDGASRYRELAEGLAEGDTRAEGTVKGVHAHIWLAQGKFADAEAGFRESMGLLEKALGPDHPDVIGSRSNLVAAIQNQGKFSEAEAEVREILADREHVLGARHPDIAASRSNLALVLTELGKYEEAGVQSRKAIALAEESLGPDHPDVGRYSGTLGNLLYVQHKYAEAESAHRRALRGSERAFGPEHPATSTARNNIANALYAQGKHAEAEAMYRRVLASQETVLGPDHPEVGTALNNLAAVLYAQRRFEESTGEQQRALDIWERALGPDHPDVAMAQHNLAYLLVTRGNFDRAMGLAEKAWNRRSRDDVPPEGRAETAFVLAQARWGAGADRELRASARGLAEDALENYRRAGDAHADKAGAVQRWLDAHR